MQFRFPNGKIKETFLSPFSVRRSSSHISSVKNIEVSFAPKQWPCFYYRLNRSHRASRKSCLQTQSNIGTICVTSSGSLTHKEHCLTFAAPPTPSLFLPVTQIFMKCHVLGQTWVQPAAGWENGSGCVSLFSNSSSAETWWCAALTGKTCCCFS